MIFWAWGLNTCINNFRISSQTPDGKIIEVNVKSCIPNHWYICNSGLQQVAFIYISDLSYDFSGLYRVQLWWIISSEGHGLNFISSMPFTGQAVMFCLWTEQTHLGRVKQQINMPFPCATLRVTFWNRTILELENKEYPCQVMHIKECDFNDISLGFVLYV